MSTINLQDLIAVLQGMVQPEQAQSVPTPTLPTPTQPARPAVKPAAQKSTHIIYALHPTGLVQIGEVANYGNVAYVSSSQQKHELWQNASNLTAGLTREQLNIFAIARTADGQPIISSKSGTVRTWACGCGRFEPGNTCRYAKKNKLACAVSSQPGATQASPPARPIIAAPVPVPVNVQVAMPKPNKPATLSAANYTSQAWPKLINKQWLDAGYSAEWQRSQAARARSYLMTEGVGIKDFFNDVYGEKFTELSYPHMIDAAVQVSSESERANKFTPAPIN